MEIDDLDPKAVTRSFLTGSHAYGTPGPESDIDLVVLLGDDDLAALAAQCEAGGGEVSDEYAGDGDMSLRFGRLNLICLTDPGAFDAWREGTAELVARKPVTRAEAVKLLDAKFAALKDSRYAAAGEALAAKTFDEDEAF